jgi:outer membrane protein TolC
MKTLFRLLLLGAILIFLSVHEMLAQTPAAGQPVASAAPLALSLPQAVDYALKHKSTLQAARLEEQISDAKIQQVKAQGLPQINAQATVTDNYKLQKSLTDFGAFTAGQGVLSGATLTPDQITRVQNGETVTLTPTYTPAPATGPQPLAFGLQWQGNAAFSGSQQLFDGSYLLGLKAAKVYKQLSVKQTQQSETEVVEQVQKAYYSTLVAGERIQLLDRNLERLRTLLGQTEQQFKTGVVEKLDVQRLQVQLNNLTVERQNAQRLIEVSVALLKFQMGLDQRQPVQLTDKLDEAVLADARQQLQQNSEEFNYGNRIEYAVLQTQRDLAALDVRNQRAGYLPKLSLVGQYGWVGSDKSLGGLTEFRGPGARSELGFANQNWFNFGNVGLQLQVPVFDGFRRRHLVQQAKLTVEQTTKQATTLQQSIDLERTQTRTTLQNGLDLLTTQQANLDLATEVARVAKIKFQSGVGSNVELITAETDLRQAQTNYYAALYDALVAKVEFQRANGSLYQPQR